jgi:hypothetical protein
MVLITGSILHAPPDVDIILAASPRHGRGGIIAGGFHGQTQKHATNKNISRKKLLFLSILLPLVRLVSRAQIRLVETVPKPGSEPETRPQGEMTMRFMVIVKADKNSEAGILPTKETKETFAAMGKFNEELVRAGVMLAGEGLQPTSKGKRVRFSGRQRTVIDGPFAETKELIAGFWLWQVKSMEEAVEWLKRAPFDGGTEVEIRQVYEACDFPADVLPPEDAAREQALRDELQRKAAKP